MGANAYTLEGRERRATQEAEMRRRQVRRVGRPRKTNWLTPAQRAAMNLRRSAIRG